MHARGDIGGVTKDIGFFPPSVTHYHQAAVDPHSHRETNSMLFGKIIAKSRDGLDCRKSCTNRPFGVVSVRLRIAEVNYQTVAEIFSDMPTKARYRRGCYTLILSGDLVPFFGIEASRDFR